MHDNFSLLQVDFTNDRFDCRKKYFITRFAAYNEDVIRSSFNDLCDFTERFTVLAANTQSKQLPG